MRSVARWTLAAALVLAGLTHLFWGRKGFRAQVPEAVTHVLPIDADGVVMASGGVEIMLGGALIALPRDRRRIGAILAAFFVAVFPGNLAQWRHHRDGLHLDTDGRRFTRLFFQPLLVAWALYATR